jgi:hypothetical protein
MTRSRLPAILSPIQTGKADAPLMQHCPDGLCCCCHLGHPTSMDPATRVSKTTAIYLGKTRTQIPNPSTLTTKDKTIMLPPSCRKLAPQNPARPELPHNPQAGTLTRARTCNENATKPERVSTKRRERDKKNTEAVLCVAMTFVASSRRSRPSDGCRSLICGSSSRPNRCIRLCLNKWKAGSQVCFF